MSPRAKQGLARECGGGGHSNPKMRSFPIFRLEIVACGFQSPSGASPGPSKALSGVFTQGPAGPQQGHAGECGGGGHSDPKIGSFPIFGLGLVACACQRPRRGVAGAEQGPQRGVHPGPIRASPGSVCVGGSGRSNLKMGSFPISGLELDAAGAQPAAIRSSLRFAAAMHSPHASYALSRSPMQSFRPLGLIFNPKMGSPPTFGLACVQVASRGWNCCKAL